MSTETENRSKKTKKENPGNGNLLGRYILIAFFFFIWAVGVVYFLAKNSLVDSSKWVERENSMRKPKIVEPVRGDILARDGSILATNEICYDVAIHYRQIAKDSTFIANVPAFAEKMAEYFPERTKQEWMDTILAPFREPVKSKRRKFFALIKGMNHDTYQEFLKFPIIDCGYGKPFRYRCQTGISISSRYRRMYPCGNMARRSIGKVGQMDTTDLKKMGKGIECKDRLFGLYGLEEALDSLLYGTQGKKYPTAGTRGIQYWTNIEPINGYNVKSTIDITLQDLLDTSLLDELEVQERKPKNAIAMLMDVKTGDLLAVSNYDYKDGKYVEAMNYAFEARYDPGSLLKTLTLLIALEDGLVPSVNAMVPVTPIQGQSKSHFEKHVKAATASDIIKKSSNTGMIHMLFAPNSPYPSHPQQYLKRLEGIGLMEPINVGNRNAVSLGYPRRKMTEKDLAQMAYGYNLDFPPILMMSIYNAVANDGKFVRPRLYTELIGEDTIIKNDVSYIRDRICSEDHARQIREALRTVVQVGGTGVRMKDCVVPLAGKTGTAQVNKDGKYHNDIWRFSFCGFMPYENPQYTIFVMFNEVNIPANTISVGRSAGQVVLRMAEKMYARGYLGDSPMVAEAKEKGGLPKVFRSYDKAAYEAAENIAGVHYNKNGQDTLKRGVVPDVVAMGLKEAIRNLETCGYNVKAEGSGFVANQTPVAGTKSPLGTTVVLHLKQ